MYHLAVVFSRNEKQHYLGYISLDLVSISIMYLFPRLYLYSDWLEYMRSPLPGQFYAQSVHEGLGLFCAVRPVKTCRLVFVAFVLVADVS